MLTLFTARITSDERREFTDFIHDLEKSKSFTLDKLVASKEDGGISCPYCHHTDPKKIVKYGVRHGVQWYRCKTCNRTFSSLSNSFLAWSKKGFDTWKRFISSMIEGHSVRRSAELCRIHRNTAWVWRHKILDALTQYQNSQGSMSGIVEADDTFFPLSYKGSKPIGRDAHQRGTPASKRGISKEKVCVSCAVEREGQVFSKVSALGPPKAKALQRVFRNRISKQATVCTDNATAYVSYGKRRKFRHIRVPNGIRLLGTYHVQNINSYHSRLKEFIRKFKGVATKYLDNYLVWFNQIQTGGRSRIELLKLAIKALVFDRWSDISDRPAVPV